MATYQIYAPAYVQGKYLGQHATYGAPARISVPDDHEPSLTWDPVDEAALKALNALVETKVKAVTRHLDPKKDEHAIKLAADEFRAKHKKALVVPAVEKPGPREVTTNSEIAGQAGKVVGRASDRSPIG